MRRLPAGIAARIALAASLVALLATAIVAAGTLILGSETFVNLMTADGHPADESRAMFDSSVGQVVVIALVVAVVAAVLLAAALARRIARPVAAAAGAARRIAGGDYAARVPRQGPTELEDLADSFNLMAGALAEQERVRRDFIANAAHELRTPLTNLQGYLEALRDGVVPAERATFESLWEETERLVRLSRSLDTLAEGDARSEPLGLVEVDVSAAVRNAATIVAPSIAQAGLSFDVEVSDGLRASADPDGVAQVLANLLQNALRYTPSPGSVRLCGMAQEGVVRVSVENSGPGIPAPDLSHVFERFYRVEKSRDARSGGAGIGLAIVRQIVESSGGAVGAESEPGRTLFWFTLPAH